MIVIIVLLVVLLGTIIVGGFFLLRTFTTPDEEVPDRATASIVSVAPGDIDYHNLASVITTNLARGVDGENRQIRIGFSIGIVNTEKESPEIFELIVAQEVVVRDIALAILGRKTAQELNRPDGKEVLAEEILESLRQEFNSNLIHNIIFSDWMII